MKKIERTTKIGHSYGLHIRVASEIVKSSQLFKSEIHLYRSISPEIQINAKAILEIMTAGIESGEEVIIICHGEDAEKAMDVIEHILTSNFDQNR